MFLALVGPALFAAWVCHCLGGGVPALERTSGRPTGAYERALVLVAAAIPVGFCAAASGEDALGAARNTVGFLGLALLVRRIAGTTPATVATVGYAVVLLTVGRPGGDAGLSWPLVESPAAPDLAIAALLGSLGLAFGCGRAVWLGQHERSNDDDGAAPHRS